MFVISYKKPVTVYMSPVPKKIRERGRNNDEKFLLFFSISDPIQFNPVGWNDKEGKEEFVCLRGHGQAATMAEKPNRS
jgi:hypothetical protein